MKLLYKNKFEQGGILILFLFILPILLCLVFSIISISWRSQQKLADYYRLDICATQVTQQRSSLLKELIKTNQAMQILRLIVYSARGAKIIIPPAGAILGLGEKAALTFLQKLKYSQTLAIQLATILETKLSQCSSTPFSQNFSFCQFPIVRQTMFNREQTLYADVPGNLFWQNGNPLLKVRCYITKVNAPSFLSVTLQWQQQLMTNIFNYDYSN